MRKLFNQVHLFFIPAKYWENEYELRKAKLLVNTTLLSALFGFFYLFNTIFFGMQNIEYNMIFCVICFSLLPFWFKSGASRITIANVFSAIALFSTGYDIFFSQGLYSWSMAWLSFSPVLAVLLLDKKYGYIWLGVSLLVGAAIGAAYMNGFRFPNEVKDTYMPIMTLNAMLGLIAIMFFVALVLDDAYNNSLVKLNQKNQQIEWEKLIAEQERQRAEKNEQAKQQFLANMSHEIRTPINALTGITNILLEKNPTDEQRRYLDIIEKSAKSLNVIINDILDITKIEVGRMQIETIQFEPKEVVEQVGHTLRHKAEEKGIAFHVEYDNNIAPILLGDPTRLNQILTNLLDNAIKFTEKGSVTLKVEKTGNRVQFTVTDTGIGMTKEQIEIIFEPFRQAEMGTTRKYGGTGLGLSISKKLVELQNGTITVESTPGKGSSFSFSIEYPTGDGAELVKKQGQIDPKIIEELKGKKILIAEDNEFNRIVAVETIQLKVPGVIIDTANTGKEALEKFSGHDIIIMDVHMPVMDGYEATRKIRSGFPIPYNHVPVVALTASITETDIKKCLTAGMNGFVPKPFNAHDLLSAMYDAIKRRPNAIYSYNTSKTRHGENNSVTDLTFLRESCSNDEERLKKYVNMYLNYAPKAMEAMQQSLQKKDYDTLKNTIHTFKVQLKYMGMHEAGIVAKNIEECCIQKKGDGLHELVEGLISACKQSITELIAYT